MIPNLDQLLLVCGISIAAVALIMWLLLKIPDQSDDNQGENNDNDFS